MRPLSILYAFVLAALFYENATAQTTPVAPTNLVATPTAQGTINLTWIDNSSNETGFQIERSLAVNTNYQSLATLGVNVTSYEDANSIIIGAKYYYRLRSVNTGIFSSYSNETSTIIPQVTGYLPPTSIATNSFVANWSSMPGATSYKLDVSGDAFTSLLPGYSGLNVVGTSQTVNGLAPGANYQYRVHTASGSYVSPPSNVTGLFTILSAPVAVAATAVTSTSFTANWNSAAGAVSYSIDVATDNLFTNMVPGYNSRAAFSATSLNVTGLSNSIYYYRIKAYSSINVESAYSNTMSINIGTTIPAAPFATGATNSGNTSFTASWNSVAGVTGYQLDVASDNNFSFIISGYNNLSVSGTSQNITGLLEGVVYYYRVRAVSAAGTSANSNVISYTVAIESPVISATPGINSFIVTWTTIPRATNYHLDISTSNTFLSFITGYNDLVLTTTSVSVTGVTAGVTYYFRVRTTSGSVTSVNSNVGSVTPVLNAPVAIAASGLTVNSFTANWNSVQGATSYKLDVSSDGFTTLLPGYNGFTVASGLSLPVTGLLEGTRYQYRVYAVSGSSVSASSNTIVATTILSAPVASAPTAVTAISFMANWSSVSTATGYGLQVATDNGFNNIINNGGGTGTSFNVTGLSVSTYYYRVFCYNSIGLQSAYSNTITVNISAIIPIAPVATTATALSTTSFTANWNSVPGATSYQLDVDEFSNSFTNLLSGFGNLSVSGTSQNITGLMGGRTFYYRVRSVNASGTSASSNVIVCTIPIAPPVAINATNVTANSFTANWNSVPNVTAYQVDISTVNDFSSFVTGYNSFSVSTNVLNVTGVTNATYYYRVRAVAVGNVATSVNSNTIQVNNNSAGGIPVATAGVSSGNTSFIANWSSVPGATGYQLDVASDYNTFVFPVAGYNNLPVSGTSQNVIGVLEGVVYYYRVRAITASGTSVNSNIVSYTVPIEAPVVNAASGVTSNSFILTWSTVARAANYHLDISTTNTFSTFITGYNDLVVPTTANNVVYVTGVPGGATYYYRVRTTSGSVISVNSNVGSVTTTLNAPVASAASGMTNNSFTANWGSIPEAIGYQLDVSAVADFSSFVTGYNNLAVTGTSQLVTGLSVGSAYIYRVRAITAATISGQSNIIQGITTIQAPVILTPTAITSSSFTASWDGVAGAVDYSLDVSTDNTFTNFTNGFQHLKTTGTSLNITGLISSNYYYRVQTETDATLSAYSNTGVVTTIAQPVAKAATDLSPIGFTANWNSVPGAVSYEIDVSKSNTFATIDVKLQSITGTTSIVQPLLGGMIYYYRVRAMNASGGISDNSNTIMTNTVMWPVTTFNSSNIMPSSFVLSWNSVANAVGYYIDVCTDNSYSNFVSGYNNALVTGTTTTIIGIMPGTNYYCRVRSYSGYVSSPSWILSLKTPLDACITFPATDVTTNSFTANWSAVPRAEVYAVDVSIDPAFSSFVGYYHNLQSVVTNQSVTGLAGGTQYYYRIMALGGDIAQSYKESNVMSVVTAMTPPILLAPTLVDFNSFTANWGTATGASSYQIDVSPNNGFTTFVTGYNNTAVTGTSQLITGLTTGSTYYYRVRAVNGPSVSNNSITGSCTLSSTANGLVGNWRLDGNATDISGYNNNGSTQNAAFSPNSKEGTAALSLNGINQYVDLGNPGIFPSGTAARSMCAWALTNTTAAGFAWVASYGNSGSGTAMFIGRNGSTLDVGGYGAPSDLIVTQDKWSWPVGEWHHICLTYNGTTAIVYVDGNQVASGARSWTLTPLKAFIGRQVNGAEYWNGSIDDVRIYNRALAPNEVLALASGAPATPSNLIATAAPGNTINLTWADNSTTETNFQVERSSLTNTSYSLLANLPANTTSYTDLNLPAPGYYYYRVRAINTINGINSAYAPETSVNTTSPFAGTRRFLIDFGDPNVQTTLTGWNNVVEVSAGSVINLVESKGTVSAVSLQVITEPSNGYGGGADFNSGGYSGQVLDYPVSACSDSHYTFGVGGTYKLNGLDNTKVYSIRIFGSRMPVSDTRKGLYTVNGKQQTLDAANNTSQTILFSNITPVSGSITIGFNVATGSTFGYINVMDIVENFITTPPATSTAYNASWTDLQNTKLATGNIITKTTSTSLWDASAVSSNVIAGGVDGWVKFSAPSSTAIVSIGLSRPNAVAALTSLDYSFQFVNGVVSIYESGINQGTVIAGSTYIIARQGAFINYYIDGSFVRSVSTPNASQLVVDTSLQLGSLPSITTSISTVAHTYYAIGNGGWTDPTIWSLSEGGPPATIYPGNSDIAIVKGFNVTITSGIYNAGVNVIVNNNNTSLKVDGTSSLLNVTGNIVIRSLNNASTADALVVQNNATVNVQ